MRGGGEKQERCVPPATLRGRAGWAPHSSHGQRRSVQRAAGAHLQNASPASVTQCQGLQHSRYGRTTLFTGAFCALPSSRIILGCPDRSVLQGGGRGCVCTEWEAGLLVSHKAETRACERGRMSLISLHSQKANDNCFGNVPCI